MSRQADVRDLSADERKHRQVPQVREMRQTGISDPSRRKIQPLEAGHSLEMAQARRQ